MRHTPNRQWSFHALSGQRAACDLLTEACELLRREAREVSLQQIRGSPLIQRAVCELLREACADDRPYNIGVSPSWWTWPYKYTPMGQGPHEPEGRERVAGRSYHQDGYLRETTPEWTLHLLLAAISSLENAA